MDVPEPVDVRAEFEGQAGRMLDRRDDFVILALESSADRASAAVVRTGMPGIQHLHEARHGHAALISELARAALAEAGVEPDEITHVAAGRGPGSFTGLRVALAAAKGSPSRRALPEQASPVLRRRRMPRLLVPMADISSPPRTHGAAAFLRSCSQPPQTRCPESSRLIPRITHRLPAHGTARW